MNLKKNQLCFRAILPLSNILYMKTRLHFVWLQIRHKQGPNNIDDVSHRIYDVATSHISLHPGGCFSQTKFFIALLPEMKGDFCLEWISLVKTNKQTNKLLQLSKKKTRGEKREKKNTRKSVPFPTFKLKNYFFPKD